MCVFNEGAAWTVCAEIFMDYGCRVCVCMYIYIYIDDKFRTQIQIVMIDHSKTSATSLGSKVSHILQL